VSQRESGYERKERDLYETPEWVTLALFPHLPRQPEVIWEPAAGSGKMARAIVKASPKVVSVIESDIETGADFLSELVVEDGVEAIITNPPYVLAQEFIKSALDRMEGHGIVAMLLRTDFDHAKTRGHLFAGHPAFAKKVVLTKRIQWFEDSKGSPSFNHAWFIWDWQHIGPPTLAYGPGAPVSTPSGSGK
jgi:methylase of polypeptide subunit release factors